MEKQKTEQQENLELDENQEPKLLAPWDFHVKIKDKKEIKPGRWWYNPFELMRLQSNFMKQQGFKKIKTLNKTVNSG